MKGKKHSAEAKLKMRKPKTEETKLKISKANKGKPSYRKGKTWTTINGKRVWK